MAGRQVRVDTSRVRGFSRLPQAQQAGMLSNDAAFRRFVGSCTIGEDVEVTAEAAAEYIRQSSKVASRRDLNTNPTAAQKFQALRTDFDAWAGRIPEQR